MTDAARGPVTRPSLSSRVGRFELPTLRVPNGAGELPGFLYFRDSGTIDTTVGRLSTWAFDQHVADLRPVLEEAMERGEIRRDDVTLLAQATLGVVQLLAGFWVEHRDHCSRAELQRFINQLLTFGSVARPPAPGVV
jgi:hypothetical protein